MSNTDWDNRNDADLWRRLAASPADADRQGDCPDATEIAAFVDGRMDDAAVTRFEMHLARCPACLAAIRDTRAILARPTIMPPRELVAQAKRLVPTGQRPSWRAVVRWTAAAAAAVVLAVAGYSAGSSTQQNRRLAERKVAEEISFGLVLDYPTETDDMPFRPAPQTGDPR